MLTMDWNFLLPTLQNLDYFGYWLTLIAAFVESLAFVGILMPGSVLIMLMGFLAARGFFDFGDLIFFAAAGAILGDGLGFYLGRRGVGFLRRRAGFIFRESYLQTGEQFFRRHGGKSVFLGRFLHPIRPVIPFVAGMVQMRSRTFILYNVLSAIPWAIFTLGIGYVFGEAWQVIEAWSSRIGLALLVFCLMLIALYYLRKVILTEGRDFIFLLRSILLSFKQALAENPELKKFVSRHPLFFRLFKGRLDGGKFTGLPLTSLGLIFLYLLFHFLGAVKNVLTAAPVVEIDARLENLLFFFRQPQLTEIFFWLTLLGQWEVVLAAAAIFSLLLWVWHRRIYLVPFWLTVGAAAAFNALGKIIIQRPRPPAVAVFAEKFFSFPSGHAALALALYGFIAYFLFLQVKSWTKKANLVFFTVVIVILVGFSRLYLGAHYLSDVTGGYFLGGMCLLAGVSLSEFLKIKRFKAAAPVSLAGKIATVCLLSSFLAFFVTFGLIYDPLLNAPATPVPVRIVAADKIIDQFSGPAAWPRYSEKLDGRAQEPLSFIIITVDERRLTAAFTAAGWLPAEPTTLTSMLRLAQAVITQGDYANAPITPAFWNTAVNNFAFEKPTAENRVSRRHHCRLWQTDLALNDGRKIYVGTASFDDGIKWLVTHRVSPDLDTERELLISDLKAVGATAEKMPFVTPELGRTAAGDFFFTDGYLYLISLR